MFTWNDSSECRTSYNNNSSRNGFISRLFNVPTLETEPKPQRQKSFATYTKSNNNFHVRTNRFNARCNCMLFVLFFAHAYITKHARWHDLFGRRQEPSDATYLSAALLIVILKQRVINKSTWRSASNYKVCLDLVRSEFKMILRQQILVKILFTNM